MFITCFIRALELRANVQTYCTPRRSSLCRCLFSPAPEQVPLRKRLLTHCKPAAAPKSLANAAPTLPTQARNLELSRDLAYLFLPAHRRIPSIDVTGKATACNPTPPVSAAQALHHAQVLALQQLLTREADRFSQADAQWALDALRNTAQPFQAKHLADYVGTFGPYWMFLEAGANR
jgi:hypothetical protein